MPAVSPPQQRAGAMLARLVLLKQCMTAQEQRAACRGLAVQQIRSIRSASAKRKAAPIKLVRREGDMYTVEGKAVDALPHTVRNEVKGGGATQRAHESGSRGGDVRESAKRALLGVTSAARGAQVGGRIVQDEAGEVRQARRGDTRKRGVDA
ncbi:hypothetical protein OH77DRAFT_1514502 [Trametes cingulata]|nr:hypothetical protein OH77DRAFT_1514502 [Trametes cingulata]